MNCHCDPIEKETSSEGDLVPNLLAFPNHPVVLKKTGWIERQVAVASASRSLSIILTYGRLETPVTSSTAPTGGRSRIYSENPLFNNIFRRQSRSSTGPGHTSTISASKSTADTDSMLASMPVCIKPLTLLKPVAAEERSYAHLLVPRLPMGYGRASQILDAGESKSEIAGASTITLQRASAASRRYQRGRSQTLSLHGISTSTSSLNSDTIYRCGRGSPGETCGTAGSGHKALGGFPTWKVTSPETPSMDSLEQRCIMYEDPLAHYDPCLLDDPLMPQLTNRRVFCFLGYVTSVLGYRRPEEHKRSINREFHLRFPAIQLSLTKMRSLKLAMLSAALKMRLDLWIVAHAYVLFEKMILKVCESGGCDNCHFRDCIFFRKKFPQSILLFLRKFEVKGGNRVLKLLVHANFYDQYTRCHF
ncbi:unnamed protein product [Schistocephalus solidus]|uniref:Cyclin N-terminal domain-containing protein n=1 Tax=Schistocephalus solidus TaxID=70667 RepID=A0A183TER9_SCHSO|nr:unnamed protein product [Schistocephalus solidus]